MRARLYIEWYGRCAYDEFIKKMFIDWFKHTNRHKYKGFTVTLSFLGWTGNVTLVNDGKLYRDAMKRRTRR